MECKKATVEFLVPYQQLTVLKMLRAQESGQVWYEDVFGFTGKIPEHLTIECVVAVSLADRKKTAFSEKLRRFVAENSLLVGKDTIEFYLANYTEERGSLSIFGDADIGLSRYA